MFSKKFSILSIVFVFIWLLLVIYAFNFRNDTFIYWILVIASALIIIYQINFVKLEKNEINFIYIQILMLFLGLKFQIISQVGLGGVYGLDTNYEIDYMHQMLTLGHWTITSADSVNGYPLIHLLGSAYSLITHIQIYFITNSIMLLMDFLIIILFILISKHLFKNDKVGLFSTLGFIFLYLFVYFSFGRMLTSVLLFFLIMYLMIRFPSRILSKLLIIIAFIGLIYSHPIAPIILVFFVIILLILEMNISKKIINKIFKNLDFKSSFHVTNNFFMILVVLILAYFVYIAIWEQNKLLDTINIFRGLESAQEVGTATQTSINWRIFLYGQGLLALIFGLTFIRYRKNVKNYNAFILMLFGVFIGLFSFVMYILGLDLIRYTIFYWPAILLSSSYILLKSKMAKILSVLLILFIIVNMSGYYMDSYNQNFDPPLGQWHMSITPQEETSVVTMNVSGRIVSNQYIYMAIKKHSQKNDIVIENPNYFLSGYKNSSSVNYFYVDKEDLFNAFLRGQTPFKVPYETYLDYSKTQHLQEIYDNGEINVFKIT